jgi:hypothetical protein
MRSYFSIKGNNLYGFMSFEIVYLGYFKYMQGLF